MTEEAAKSAIEVMGHYDQDGVVFDSFISHRSSGAEQNKQPHQNQHQHHQPKDHQKPPSPNSSLAQSSYLANDAMAGQHSFFSGQHAPNGLGLENPGIDAMYTARSEASTHSATIHSTESVSSEASSSNNSMKLGNNSPIGVNETPKMMVMAAPPPSAGKKSLKPTIESDRDHIDPMMGMQRSRFPQGNGYDGMESFRPPATYPSRRNQNDLSFPAFPFHQQQPQMGDNLNYMYNRDPYGAPHTNPFLANANGYGKLQPELYYGGGGDGMHSNHHFTRNERMGGHHHQNQHHHQQQSFHHRSNITQQMMNQEQFQYHDSHQMHGQFRGPTPDHRYTPQQYDPRPHLSHSPANNSYHSSMPPSLHQQHTSQLPSQLPSQLSSAQLSQTFSQPSSIDDLRSEFFPQPESRWNHLSATSQFNFEQQRTTSNLALSKSPGHRQSSLPTSDFTLESSNKALFDREPSESLLESFDYLKISSSASKTHDLHAVSALSSNLLSASPSTFLSQLHSNTNSLNATLDSTNSILGNISMTDITQNRFDGLSTGDNYTPF